MLILNWDIYIGFYVMYHYVMSPYVIEFRLINICGSVSSDLQVPCPGKWALTWSFQPDRGSP